jgi:SAM-dependent methyltransferase
MKNLDRFLQSWRIDKVCPFVQKGSRVLDIGCSNGELFERLGDHISEGVGIDPGLKNSVRKDRFQLVAGHFPEDLPDVDPFDVITLLAVVEHIPETLLEQFATDCERRLKPEGLVVITAPSTKADILLKFLKSMRIIDGMNLDEHHGLDIGRVPLAFSGAGLELIQREKFELGANNLLVFRKSEHHQVASSVVHREVEHAGIVL